MGQTGFKQSHRLIHPLNYEVELVLCRWPDTFCLPFQIHTPPPLSTLLCTLEAEHCLPHQMALPFSVSGWPGPMGGLAGDQREGGIDSPSSLVFDCVLEGLGSPLALRLQHSFLPLRSKGVTGAAVYS